MQLNAFFPTRDIGTDPAKIRDWAQAAQDLGYAYIEVPDHVVGHFDVGIAQILGRLRPVADLGGIGADVARREEGVELHGCASRCQNFPGLTP